MAASHLIDAVQQLLNPGTSQPQQLAALKALKNGIIGHPRKKDLLARHGLIECLRVALGVSEIGKRGIKLDDSSNGEAHQTLRAGGVFDEIRLQAITIMGSLAHGRNGNAYIVPMSGKNLMHILFDALIPTLNPAKIVLASVRSLLTIVRAGLRDVEACMPLFLREFFDGPQYIEGLAQILAQQKQNATVQNQISLVCQLIKWSVTAEHEKAILAEAGVIERLGDQIMAYYVHSRSQTYKTNASLLAQMSPPTPRSLPLLLGALSTIVGNSRYRASRFLYYPPVLTLFPFQPPLSGPDRHHFGAQDDMLPWLNQGLQKQDNFSKAFPALGSIQPLLKKNNPPDFQESYQNFAESTTSGWDSSFIPWIMYYMRSEASIGRIEAAALLTSFIEAGFYIRGQERTLAMLVVPLLLSFLDESTRHVSNEIDMEGKSFEEQESRIQAATMLATLMKLHPSLQKAAFDGAVISKACAMLKKTFEPLAVSDRKPLEFEAEELPATLKYSNELANPALPLEVWYCFRSREAALLLIAAIADREDKYRKHLTERLIIPLVIQSLAEFADEDLNGALKNSELTKLDDDVGSPASVVNAACNAAKAMSRSVSLLRTSLVDAGLGKPCLDLLDRGDPDVLAGALDVIANIITEFSQIRDTLIGRGIVKKLCTHAHSATPGIRLRSLWALKHLLYHASNEIKIEIFQEINIPWLIQLITGASMDEDTSTSFTTPHPSATQPSIRAAANAVGGRVDLLNSTSDPMDTSDSTELPRVRSHSIGSTSSAEDVLPEPNFDTYNTSDRPLLSALYSLSLLAPAQQAALDNLEIQIQGFDFLRNLTQGPNAGSMIDMLFSAIEPSKLFEILNARLVASPRASDPSPDNTVGTSNTRAGAANISNMGASGWETQFQPPHLLQSVLYILVHLAASPLSQHRSLITSHPTILPSTVLPLTYHPSSGVRIAIMWIFINLTWVDDAGDRSGAEERAKRLREMGVAGRLREMMGSNNGHGDESVDVRERAGVAWEGCCGRRMDGAGGSGSGSIGGIAGSAAAGAGAGTGAGVIPSLGTTASGLGRAR